MSGLYATGNAYFDQTLDGGATYAGLFFVGNATKFEIKENGSLLTRPSMERGTRGIALSTVANRQPQGFSVEWDEQGNAGNLELSTMGESTAVSQASATGTSVTATLILNKPVIIVEGLSEITNVAIVGKVEGTDFRVYSRLGAVEALNSGTAGSQTITYDKAAATGFSIVGGAQKSIRGRWVLDGINEDGDAPIRVNVWDAVMLSGSVFDPLVNSFAKGTLTGNINQPTGAVATKFPAATGPYEVLLLPG